MDSSAFPLHTFSTSLRTDSGFALLAVDSDGKTEVLKEAARGWLTKSRGSPDGRSLAFNQRQSGASLVLLENFQNCSRLSSFPSGSIEIENLWSATE